MTVRNVQIWVLTLTLVLVQALGVEPVQSAAPHPPTSAEDRSAYLIHPVRSAAQQASTQQYQAINPAQGLQLGFGPDHLAVTAQQAGDQPWQLTIGLESNPTITARAAVTSTVTGNRLTYHQPTLNEWYVNAEQGVKHGFTLYTRPDQPENAALELHLSIGGTLHARVSNDGQAVDFVTANGAALLRYAGLTVFDAQQRELPAHFSATTTGIALVIDDRGATYPLTVDPLLTNYLAKRTTVDGAAGDFLGYDVNVSGDTAVVGAYGADTAQGVDAGRALIYERNQGGFNRWNQVVELQASDGAAGDEFGHDTYVTGAQTAIIGAPGQDEKGTDAGAAYIFARNQGGPGAWGQEAKLVATDGAANERFGSIVSIQANTAVVGVPTADRHGMASGAVYIFERVAFTPSVWSQITVLVPADSAAGDNFGAALVISDDTLFVGAPKADDACPNDPDCDAGAVYIFERNQGGANQWGLLKKVKATDAAAGDTFGHAVAYSDDRLLVGAPNNDQQGANAGAVYIFDRNLGGLSNWGQRALLVAPDGAAGDQFGYAVGIGGSNAIVGAPFDSDNGSEAGAAYLLYRNVGGGNQWGVMSKVIAADGASGDHFGRAVDQRSGNAVIGAYGDDDQGSDAGSLYFYRIPFTIGTLQVVNQVTPANPATTWEVMIKGLVTISDTLAGDDQTEAATVFAGTYTVTERAGANTDPHQYSTTWRCAVNGNPGPSGSGITFTVAVGADENVVCTFTNAPPTATGTVIIAKQTMPGGGTGFTFTDTLAAPNSFTLNDTGQQTFTNVAPGSYQVTEAATAGWQVTGLTCVDPDNGSSASGATATIDLDAGETVLCTFTNSQTAAQVGTIVINKQSAPAGGTDFAFTQNITTPTSFSLNDGGSKTFTNVPADSYEVTEVAAADWSLSSATCTDPDNGSSVSGATATIDLDAGETVTCTFINAQVTGQDANRLFLPLVIR